MNYNERNRLYMLQAVNRTLNQYQEVWENAPEMVNLQAELAAYEEKSTELISRKMNLKQPYASVKEAQWQSFVDLCAKVAGLLKLHAHQSANKELFNSLHFSEARLLRTSSQAVVAYGTNLRRLFADSLESMSDHSQKQELLDTFTEQLRFFTDNALAPSDRRRLLGETTQKIANLQQEVREFLENIADSLMLFYRKEHPDFYLAWSNARIIPKFRGGNRPNDEELDPLSAPLVEETSDATSPDADASAPESRSEVTPDASPLRPTAEGASPPTNVQNGSPNPSSDTSDTEEAA